VRQETVGQLLLCVSKLHDLSAVSAETRVSTRGALWQMFKGVQDRGTGENLAVGAHVLPRLVLFDGCLPHFRLASPHYQTRMIGLFARTMWVPETVNLVDCIIEDINSNLHAGAVQAVCAGNAPRDVFDDYMRALSNVYETLLNATDTYIESAAFRHGMNHLELVEAKVDSPVQKVLQAQYNEVCREPQVLSPSGQEAFEAEIDNEQWSQENPTGSVPSVAELETAQLESFKKNIKENK
jgi:hypothetical protein